MTTKVPTIKKVQMKGKKSLTRGPERRERGKANQLEDSLKCIGSQGKDGEELRRRVNNWKGRLASENSHEKKDGWMPKRANAGIKIHHKLRKVEQPDSQREIDKSKRKWIRN